jgi:ribosomal protein L37AE/L43A
MKCPHCANQTIAAIGRNVCDHCDNQFDIGCLNGQYYARFVTGKQIQRNEPTPGRPYLEVTYKEPKTE